MQWQVHEVTAVQRSGVGWRWRAPVRAWCTSRSASSHFRCTGVAVTATFTHTALMNGTNWIAGTSTRAIATVRASAGWYHYQRTSG